MMPSARVAVTMCESASVPAVARGPASSIWGARVARGRRVAPAPAPGLEGSEEQLWITGCFGVKPERRGRRAAPRLGCAGKRSMKVLWEVV